MLKNFDFSNFFIFSPNGPKSFPPPTPLLEGEINCNLFTTELLWKISTLLTSWIRLCLFDLQSL